MLGDSEGSLQVKLPGTICGGSSGWKSRRISRNQCRLISWFSSGKMCQNDLRLATGGFRGRRISRGIARWICWTAWNATWNLCGSVSFWLDDKLGFSWENVLIDLIESLWSTQSWGYLQGWSLDHWLMLVNIQGPKQENLQGSELGNLQCSKWGKLQDSEQ